MTAEALAMSREAAVVEIDAAARDNGHDPHPWDEDGDTARTACRKCGATAAVRVRASGTWKAGSLRFTKCPG